MHYAITFAAHNFMGKLLLSKQWLFFNADILDARQQAIKKVKRLKNNMQTKQFNLLAQEGFISFDIELLKDMHSYYLGLHFVHSNGISVEIFGDKKWALENLKEEAYIISKKFNVVMTVIYANGSKFSIIKDDCKFLTAPNG